MDALVLLLACTLGPAVAVLFGWQAVTGRLRWDAEVSRRTKATINTGLTAVLVVAAPLALVTLGPWSALATVAIVGVLLLGYNLFAVAHDRLFIGDDSPRTITHANGRRAVVNKNSYRRLINDPQQQQPQDRLGRLLGWLDRLGG
jgi:hypothetical protein